MKKSSLAFILLFTVVFAAAQTKSKPAEKLPTEKEMEEMMKVVIVLKMKKLNL